jgi:asparagine synthase (glutamine-hydrolysing)
MTATLVHRGPDATGTLVDRHVALGFQRLSIIDVEGGNQPFRNEDGTLALVCNGEIFNHRELRAVLTRRGHKLVTNCDVEVLVHLYEEHGPGMVEHLDGQFAFAIYDYRNGSLFLARDHFGILPLFYTVIANTLIFASEIKAILAHPFVSRQLNLTGLDLMLSLPSAPAPWTMFRNIQSLKYGSWLYVAGRSVRQSQYWDLDYPAESGTQDQRTEADYVDELVGALDRSVAYRLQADVPVGLYVSGGLDSSMIAAMAHRIAPGVRRHSFSVSFTDPAISEAKYQRLMAKHVGSCHHEVRFDSTDISQSLRRAIYHAECPLKETYDTASLALSDCARQMGVKVILNGEGADELFAGYAGYRFDKFRINGRRAQEEDDRKGQIRELLWGDHNLHYDKDQLEFRSVKTALFSHQVNDLYEHFDYFRFDILDKTRVGGRHPLHQRSYIDFNLKLAAHLLADHGDRMGMANSVEIRYPFLSLDVVNVVRRIPPDLKLRGFTEKYILKQAGRDLLPTTILDREKFGFVAPGSPSLLKSKDPWILDMLSPTRIDRQGYFNSAEVERLTRQYSAPGFELVVPFEDDLLMFVATFGLFVEVFGLPSL